MENSFILRQYKVQQSSLIGQNFLQQRRRQKLKQTSAYQNSNNGAAQNVIESSNIQYDQQLDTQQQSPIYERPILDISNLTKQTYRNSKIKYNTKGTIYNSLSNSNSLKEQPFDRLKIFSGTSNSKLAQETACYLGSYLGSIKVKRFADGEIYVQVQESIRGCDVFLIQPTCPPVNDNLMELLVMIDACRRASARSITAVLPYYGYARADRKSQGRESIAAKLTANLLTCAGVNRVMCVDLHSGQCVGYFDIPVDHVYGESVLLDYLTSKRISSGELVVVSPDVGGVARARAFAKKLNDAPLAIVDKRRSSHNTSEVMNLIGDVNGKVAVLLDDMIDTAGTITNSGKVCHENGARAVYACATHPVFSPPAVQRLSSGIFQEVIVTNTIPLSGDQIFPELTILSVANLLAEAIWKVYHASSAVTI